MALETILDDPYTFELDFVRRNNKTECDLWFVRDNKRINPVDASGGGAVDIAALASRIALWSLGSSANTLIFDEPFRFVSANYRQKVAEFVRKISEQLVLQIIQVTHDPSLVQQSNCVIHVSKKNKISSVNIEEV